jgi:phage baseplate assembly protein gpV
MDFGSATLRVIGKLYVQGDVEITGKIDVAGNVTSAADVRASGKSLVSHVHGGVTPGGATTGAPI